jgi:hypothetical protein
MPPKPTPKSAVPKAVAKPDARFSSLLQQPRFKTKTGKVAKSTVEQDERFKDVFGDEDFEVKNIDKYQRVKKQDAKDSLSKLYDTSEIKVEPKKAQKITPKSLGPKSKVPPQKAPIQKPSSLPQPNPKRKLPKQATMDSDDDDDGDDGDDGEESIEDDVEQDHGEDEDDDSSTDIGTDDDLDDHDDLDENDQEIIPEGYTHGSLPGSYAPLIDEPTKRLALYNMEWEQLRAVDILAIFRSLCPVGGSIPRVSVYPSEKGKIMLEREKRGDFTLWTDPEMDRLANQIKEERLEKKRKIAEKIQTEQQGKKGKKNNNNKENKIKIEEIELSDDEEYVSDTEIDKLLFGNDEEDKKVIEQNRVRLKEYELAKLGYYYAIIECNTVDAAIKLYQEADGLEYESSGNVFDLRFVPDGHVFDESTLRDRATMVPPGHRPPVFQTSCLNSTRIECTWEREDPHRARFLQQDFSNDDYHVDDLTAFLANESDDEGFNTDVPISETDDESDEINSDDSDGDDDDGENGSDDDGYITSGSNKKIRHDNLGRDRIAGTKIVDGKKKNVLLLKRGARKEFASILAEIKLDSGSKKTQQDKKAIIKKANDEIAIDNDEENDGVELEDKDDDFGGDDDEDWEDEDDEVNAVDHDDHHDDDEEEKKEDIKPEESKKSKKFTKNQKYVPPPRSIDGAFGKIVIDGNSDISEAAAYLHAKKQQRKNQVEINAKKPLILLSTAANITYPDGKPIKETRKSLNFERFREQRIDQWGEQFSTNLAKAHALALVGRKQAKLSQIQGSIYDDDVVDDDDFFKHTEEYFPAAEFGQVSFSKEKKTQSDDDEDQEKEIIKKAGKNASKLSKSMNDNDADADSDQDEGYNLQELVKKNQIKQMAIKNKKKSSKENEADLINQSLGVDSYTTNQNTSLSAKDLKQAAYLVNRQAVDKTKNKKLKVNLNDLSANHEVSLAAGGPVESTPFKVDVNDARIASVFDDADFGIDTTSALFQNTEGTSDILAEAQRRRAAKQSKQIELTKKRKAGASVAGKRKDGGGVSDEISALIAKTKTAAKSHK